MAAYAIGIDLGGTTIKGALVEQGEGIVHETATATESDDGPAHVIDRIVKLIAKIQETHPEKEIQGIGVGVPGAIGWDRAIVPYLSNLPGWTNINLREEIQQRLSESFPVVVDNDANVAGLGCAHYGAGRPYTSFIMITLGTGVGGAIIYQNRIFRGATGAAGEVGHMSIDYEGPFDRSGIAGAIEAYIGQKFLSRHARYRLLPRTESMLHKMAGPDLKKITPKMLYEAALANDDAAKEMLAWAGHKLGCMLGSAVNLLDIRKVIVGGGVSLAGDFILEPARQALMHFVLPSMRDGVEIIQETRGNEVGMQGAAHLVFQHLEAHGSSKVAS